jgi:hypothetical protein
MFSTILYGCLPNPGDYDIDLPNNYSLVRSSAHIVTINKQIDEGVWNSSIIPEKVTELSCNDEYVLAKQVDLKFRNPNDPNDTYKIPDESKVNYWILDVNKDIAYGPFNETEFYEKKNRILYF